MDNEDEKIDSSQIFTFNNNIDINKFFKMTAEQKLDYYFDYKKLEKALDLIMPYYNLKNKAESSINTFT